MTALILGFSLPPPAKSALGSRCSFGTFTTMASSSSAWGGKAIFDKRGKWDLLDWDDETRRNNPNYTVITYHPFYWIPYDYIVKLDMQTDQYSGYPSLYVEYARDGMPYEEILYGRTGVYDTKKPTYLFDSKMREKLK
jgi:hypothetical protein